jgi:hypothetical protein
LFYDLDLIVKAQQQIPDIGICFGYQVGVACDKYHIAPYAEMVFELVARDIHFTFQNEKQMIQVHFFKLDRFALFLLFYVENNAVIRIEVTIHKIFLLVKRSHIRVSNYVIYYK